MRFFIFFLALAMSVQGFPGTSGNTRIVGGDLPSSYPPYHAVIISRDSYFYWVTCGASILNERWLLTSAMCTLDRFVDYMADVGIITFLSRPYAIERVIRHEKFDPENLTNDIAVVKVHRRIVFSDTVQPTKLADWSPIHGATVKIAGYGQTWGFDPNEKRGVAIQAYGAKGHRPILEANVTVIDLNECRSQLPNKTLLDSQFCTLTEGSGFCRYDEGGAAIEFRSEEAFQVGIMSWHHKCYTDIPNVYTAVAPFKTWIAEKIAE